MKLQLPKRLTREFIKLHNDYTFVYGTDYQNQTYKGQAAVAKGLPNTYPVPTKKMCCMILPRSFWQDHEFNLIQKPIIDKWISNIPRNKPIILFPRIGCGHAKMPEVCPKTYEYLMSELNKLVYETNKGTDTD